jgi:hypothetical protein
MPIKLIALIFLSVLVGLAQPSVADEDLAKTSQNPVGNLISLPDLLPKT